MAYARKSLISLADTPYYHVIARCVRRAWLCGRDEYSGKDYSHRKAWVLDRIKQLSETFAIDTCAYAVMSNHYHLVLHVDQRRTVQWTQQDVVERWTTLFRKPRVIKRWEQGKAGPGEIHLTEQLIEHWRQRLYDISWYMRCLNEYLARRANAEDECTGRFWEGRFKSQALLDDAGLLTAMTYVDLNPIRAGIAEVPEESAFTSIHERLEAWKLSTDRQRSEASWHNLTLLGFRDETPLDRPAIPFSFVEYLELVDWTGRERRVDKGGAISAKIPGIIQRLNLDVGAWQASMQSRGKVFGRALGRLDRLRLHAKTLGQSWIKGVEHAKNIYGEI